MRTTIKYSILGQFDADSSRNIEEAEQSIRFSQDTTDEEAVIISSLKKHVFALETANTFDKTLTQLLDGIDKSKVKFLQVFCYNATPDENKTPVTFEVQTGATKMFSASAFSILATDDDGIEVADISFSNITVEADKVANLVIYIGIKE